MNYKKYYSNSLSCLKEVIMGETHGLKFSAIFLASAGLLNGCQYPEPIRTEKTDNSSVTYEVLLVRRGCEVGRASDKSRGFEFPPVVICPRPAANVDLPADEIGADIKYTKLYEKFGCEVGILDLHNGYTVVLCPETGEGAVKYMETYGKGQHRNVDILQNRPK